MTGSELGGTPEEIVRTEVTSSPFIYERTYDPQPVTAQRIPNSQVALAHC